MNVLREEIVRYCAGDEVKGKQTRTTINDSPRANPSLAAADSSVVDIPG
jgi:hypothetical protein